MHRQRELVHAFTVDVEDWYHGASDAATRDGSRSRLATGVDRLLDLLAQHDARATFFWLAAAARENPRLLRKVALQGHEIGCHGDEHRRVDTMAPAMFRRQTARAFACLADLCGKPPLVYRAPYFSINAASAWAFEALVEVGFAADSSVVPIARYGNARAPTRPYRIQTGAGPLTEYPLTVARYGPLKVPATGGSYFRLYPYGLTRRHIGRLARRGQAANFYIHPWELDADHPRLPAGRWRRWLHDAGMETVEPKLARLLADFRFTSLTTAGAVGDPRHVHPARRIGDRLGHAPMTQG
jgi:polysaccharide deacetylase family protein (PEP-CTERM system associated)